MKTKIYAGLLFTSLMFLASCSKSNDNMQNNSAQVAGQAVSTGNWRVSSFNDNGVNETGDFAGYSFVFTGSVITATKNGVTVNGTWSINTSSVKFIIDLGPKGSGNKPLGDLTDDWRIISANDVQIQLKDDGNTEFLTFSKN